MNWTRKQRKCVRCICGVCVCGNSRTTTTTTEDSDSQEWLTSRAALVNFRERVWTTRVVRCSHEIRMHILPLSVSSQFLFVYRVFFSQALVAMRMTDDLAAACWYSQIAYGHTKIKKSMSRTKNRERARGITLNGIMPRAISKRRIKNETFMEAINHTFELYHQEEENESGAGLVLVWHIASQQTKYAHTNDLAKTENSNWMQIGKDPTIACILLGDFWTLCRYKTD